MPRSKWSYVLGGIDREEPSKACLLKFLCVPLSLHVPVNVYQTFVFSSSYEFPSSALKSQSTTTPNILFCL